MRNVNFLLIGGGLVCHNAAKAIRQADKNATILLVGNEPHRPYNRPPLTKEYMQGKDPLEKAYCESTDWYAQNKVDLLVGTQVTSIDARQHHAMLSDGQAVYYDKALLGTGGRPITLGLPNESLAGVHYLRTINDAATISQKATEMNKAVVLGSGFIGVEMASSLTQRGVQVTLVHPGEHIYSRFAKPMLADFVEARCRDKGVVFVPGHKARAFQGGTGLEGVELDDGLVLQCQLLVAATGIVANVELAQAAGLKVDNGVLVNEYMQTSDADIYAGGDIANFIDRYSNRRRRVEHWGQADYTGTLAGQNMTGAAQKYELLTYIWTDVFDIHIEAAGDESIEPDRTILRGRLEDNSFAILNTKAGLVTAYYAVNMKKKQYKPFGQLIEQRVNVAGKEKQLADATFDLTTLPVTV